MKKNLILFLVVLFSPLVQGQEASEKPRLPWDGFELFSHICTKFPVKFVSDFSEVESAPRGIVIILGNGNTPFLSGERLNKWVQRGGSLLVGCDRKPEPDMEEQLGQLTGYHWSDFTLRQRIPRGLDGLPENDFSGNNFVIPVQWNKPRIAIPGLDAYLNFSKLGISSTESARVFLNRPNFLIPVPGAFESEVLGRFPRGLIMLTPVREIEWIGAQPIFGCVVRPNKKGVAIQLSDEDMFSNQLLEVRDNVEFAWWCLEQLMLGGASSSSEPVPLLFVVKGQIQSPFSLPAPPIPLPDVDPYTALSIAARALDEALPGMEESDGIFANFSRRVTSHNYLVNVIWVCGVALFLLGCYLIFRFRWKIWSRETGNPVIIKKNQSLDSEKKGSGKTQEKYKVVISIFDDFQRILKKHHLAIWQVPFLESVPQKSPPRKSIWGARNVDWKQTKQEILGFLNQNQASLQMINPSDVGKIRSQLATLDELLQQGLIKVTHGRMTPGESLV